MPTLTVICTALLGSRRGRAIDLLALAALATAGSAIIVNRRAKRAEADNPAKGRFVTASGVRLHYVERGQGLDVLGAQRATREVEHA